MFHLDKRKIFLLYQYYLLGQVEENEEKSPKDLERTAWLINCLQVENHLRAKITENLKETWGFSHLPPLEKAVLIFAAYELTHFLQPLNHGKIIIDQVINFSQVYLEENKFKYINKNLDLLWKSLKVKSEI